MKEVTFIFVNTKRTLYHRILGWIINAFEHGDDFASHVAIEFEYLKGYGPIILEATGKGVNLVPSDKYDLDESQCRITLKMTNNQYLIMEQKAIEIAEHKYTYSYLSCLIGGIANSFSRKLATYLAKKLNLDTDEQLNCSEAGTKLVRSVYPDFCKDWAGSQITPYDLYIQLIVNSVRKNLTISKIANSK
jgi:hypothetical protein